MCSRKPLLARVGRCDGRPFLWVKHNKARIDLIIIGGVTRLKCRECHRFHTITVGDRVESTVD